MEVTWERIPGPQYWIFDEPTGKYPERAELEKERIYMEIGWDIHGWYSWVKTATHIFISHQEGRQFSTPEEAKQDALKVAERIISQRIGG